MLKVDNYFEAGNKFWPIKEAEHVIQVGCSGLDVKVPSTSDPGMLVCVNACRDDVQNCRQIAAIKTVILIGNENNGHSKSQGT